MFPPTRRALIASLLPLLLSSHVAHAADDPPAAADRDAIRAVIEAQIEAFRADDGGRAFSFASPGIRQLFGDAGTFMAMVRHGYLPVYRPRGWTFGPLRMVEGHWLQAVRLVGPDGRHVTALYDMEKQADGRWLIAGCQLFEDDGSV